MTISTEVSKNQYTGNAATTVFAYTFKITDASHLGVYIADDNDERVLPDPVLNTDYTVSGVGDEGGGNVTYPISGSPLPSGYKITINRESPLLQPTDLENQGGYFAEVQEDALDYLTMITQGLQEQLDRCPKVDISTGQTGEDYLIDIDDAVADAEAAAAAAAASEAAAGVSEGNAAASEAAASVSESNAAASEAAAALAVADINLLKPVEQATPNNTVLVWSGHFVNSSGSNRVEFAGGSSPVFSPVTADSRIDLLTINDSGVLGITAGAQSASPVAPLYPTDVQVLAHVLINETGTVVINQADITDARFFLNLSGGGGSEEFRENYVVGTPKDNYTGSLTVFDLKDGYIMGGANLKVYYEGVALTPGVDYTETDVDTVTMILPVATGRLISFIWAVNVGVGDAGAVSGITASATPEANKLLALNASSQFPTSTIPYDNTLNMLVNGGMEVWQRGASFSSPANGDYLADEWYIGDKTASPTYTVSRSTSNLGHGSYSMRINVTSGAAGEFRVYQIPERWSNDASAGQSYSASARVVCTTASTIRLVMYNGSTEVHSSYHTGSGSAETLTVTHTKGSDMRLYFKVDSTNTSDIYIDDVMLVRGDQAISFMPEDPSIELMRCQRYYETGDGGEQLFPMSLSGSNLPRIRTPRIRNATTKASTPTVTITTSSVELRQIAELGTGNLSDTANWTISASSVTDDGFIIDRERNSSQTGYSIGKLSFTWTAEV